MTWFAWRQQRTEVYLGALLLALLIALFVPTGLHMQDAYESDGAAACVASQAAGCGPLLDGFDQRFSTTLGITDWFALLPVLIALIFAAPFVLELERGIHRLAWTQSITRRRWLVVKLTAALGGAGICAAGIALLLTWWRRPLDNFHGRIEPGAFQLEGVAPVVYTLFAAALIIALGTILRRTVPAIALAIVAFFAVRIVIESSVRPHYASAEKAANENHLDTAWVLHGAPDVTFQPSSRFWEFQSFETAIYLVLTILLLALVGWWIDRRVS